MQNTPDKKNLVFTTKIGKISLLFFLLITLIPLIGISYYFSNTNKKSIQKQKTRALESNLSLKKKLIDQKFDNYYNLLKSLSSSQENTTILTYFSDAFQNDSLPLNEFTNSYKWQTISESYCSDLGNFKDYFSLYDILLLDMKGNVLYSINKEDDLGRNVLTGKYKNTRFSESYKKTIIDGKMHFSDFERYEPSNNEISSFLSDILLDEDGEKIGVIFIQIEIKDITELLTNKIKKVKTVDHFIIGTDLVMRTESLLDSSENALITKVEDEQTLLWKNEHVIKKKDEKHLATIYTGRKGYEVLGLHGDFHILDKQFAIITEISTEELFSSIQDQRMIAISIIALLTVIIFIIIVLLLNTFISPIISISKWAEEIVSGDIRNKSIQIKNKDEVSLLTLNFQKVVESFIDISKLAEDIARGDFSKDIDIRGENDILSIALNDMIQTFRNVVVQTEKIADGNYSFEYKLLSENDVLGKSLIKMRQKLVDNQIRLAEEDWQIKGSALLAKKIRGDIELEPLSNIIISFLCNYFDGHIGSLYLNDSLFSNKDDNSFVIYGKYAYSSKQEVLSRFKINEGILGQVVYDKTRKVINELGDDDRKVGSIIISKKPKYLLVQPIILNNEVIGVIEIATLYSIDDRVLAFLDRNIENIAIQIISASTRTRLSVLLNETIIQSKELVTQQEELTVKNEELAKQKSELQASEEELYTQREELKSINSALKDNNKVLEERKLELERKNEQINMASLEIETKARELEITSKYKSEFLANMSHELRTPLNSLMILAKQLSKNNNNNLTDKQLKSSNIIYNSGADLLNLINEILDLSKIEAGKIEVNYEKVIIKELITDIENQFLHVAEDKNIEMIIEVSEDFEEEIITDKMRVWQVLKNFLSNSFKFTSEGTVKVKFSKTDPRNKSYRNKNFDHRQGYNISVSDTGIGIAKEKMGVIFEAFQQADGTTSRKYGGTGLGLSISRELAKLLGGYISLESEEGKGSRFSLIIPINNDSKLIPLNEENNKLKIAEKQKIPFKEKRKLQINDKNNNKIKLLIIEDDVIFLDSIIDSFKEFNNKIEMETVSSGIDGLRLLEKYNYKIVILDFMLPDMNGNKILNSLGKDLVSNIPLLIVNSSKELTDSEFKEFSDYTDHILIKTPDSTEVLSRIIQNYFSNEIINKDKNKNEYEKNSEIDIVKDSSSSDNFQEIDYPLSMENLDNKKVLIVDDDIRNVYALSGLLEEQNMEIFTAENGVEALEILDENKEIEIVLMDIMMPIMDGYETMEKIREKSIFKDLPILAITAKTGKKERGKCIKSGASDYMSKPINEDILYAMMNAWLGK